jgi:hypothetical protein
LSLAGQGAPSVAEYAVAEFAAAVGLATEAGKWFLDECLELRYRLPRHWQLVVSGRLSAWRARRVAAETIGLTPEAAAFVDVQVASVAGTIRPAQLDRTVNEAIGRFMPDEVERLAAASWDKRHVTIHDQLVSFTGTMTVEAELDIADALDLEAAVAAGARQRADLGSHQPLDVRRAQAVGNIAALCRRHHRLKTHSPWRYAVIDPGTYLWTSPHGYQYLRDPAGTTDVSADVSADRPRPKLPDT